MGNIPPANNYPTYTVAIRENRSEGLVLPRVVFCHLFDGIGRWLVK